MTVNLWLFSKEIWRRCVKLLNMMFCFLLLFFGTTLMGQEVSDAPHTEWLSLLNDVTVMKQIDGAVVGQGVLCDYNSIQAAIDSGATKVLVTNTGSPYLENIEFESRDIAIEGGYDNCLTAKEGKLGTEKSVIDGSALSAVISVVGQDPAEDVVMSFNNLVLRNGNAVNGGGLSFGADVYGMAQLDNMIIENNLANISGGGVLVGDPGFVKPENFDFHLTSGSPAIDYCDNWLVTPQYLDFDGSIRGVDYIPKANLYGPYDLGFDEFF